MGHSISGVYGMKYIDSYRDEVTFFIRLDSSVPSQHVGMTIVHEPSEIEDTPVIPEVSADINQQ